MYVCMYIPYIKIKSTKFPATSMCTIYIFSFLADYKEKSFVWLEYKCSFTQKKLLFCHVNLFMTLIRIFIYFLTKIYGYRYIIPMEKLSFIVHLR